MLGRVIPVSTVTVIQDTLSTPNMREEEDGHLSCCSSSSESQENKSAKSSPPFFFPKVYEGYEDVEDKQRRVAVPSCSFSSTASQQCVPPLTITPIQPTNMTRISDLDPNEDLCNMTISVVFEGNIGAGKSTLIKRVRTILDPIYKVHVKEEKVAEWMTQSGNLLKKYYQNPRDYAFKFQMNAVMDRILQDRYFEQRSERWEGVNIVLSERSRVSDRIFARVAFECGNMNTEDMEVYEKTYDVCGLLLPERKDLVYILRTNVEQCARNINSRSRSGEENIKLDYLRSLEKHHNSADWTSRGSICAIEIEYENEDINDVAHQISGDIIHMMLSEFVRRATGKTASEKDMSTVRLSRVYMNYLRNQYSRRKGRPVTSGFSQNENNEKIDKTASSRQDIEDFLGLEGKENAYTGTPLRSLDGKVW